jgi:hypothetical protein
MVNIACCSLVKMKVFDANLCLDRKRQLLHKKAWVEMISWEPRAFIYHNFLVLYSSINSVFVCHSFLVFNFYCNGGYANLTILMRS